jgi:hypothetical protein
LERLSKTSSPNLRSNISDELPKRGVPSVQNDLKYNLTYNYWSFSKKFGRRIDSNLPWTLPRWRLRFICKKPRYLPCSALGAGLVLKTSQIHPPYITRNLK